MECHNLPSSLKEMVADKWGVLTGHFTFGRLASLLYVDAQTPESPGVKQFSDVMIGAFQMKPGTMKS